MDSKQRVLEKVLTSSYNTKDYLHLCTELFNGFNVLNPDKPNEKVWSEYKYHISSFTNIGRYTVDNNKILILAVELQKDRSIERARSMQRNFVAKLLSNYNYDAAIAAFYTKDDERWRLSFVHLDYEFVSGRAKEKLTPAKRYSYLVGKGEPCHTAMEQLYPIFLEENFSPTIDKLEEAFSVERVTNEFFKKYKEKYFELKEKLEENDDFIEEAELHQFTSEQFAKKLMGQIAFLYFLQKKGWLGVNAFPKSITEKEYNKIFYKSGKTSREAVGKAYKKVSENEYILIKNVFDILTQDEQKSLAKANIGKTWGSGPKNFIRELYDHCQNKKGNFLNDFLEPLFYDALNENRIESNYYFDKLHCRIPFLNGGLFEPLDDYDWKHNNLNIPNKIFSNKNILGECEADGILDIFDRFNFTMNEDEPLEREVAVDPEMLGKIFENLLEVKDRKSKGAFYTPREIVHYMCQESLINYLSKKTDIPYQEIKEFILFGESMKDEDSNAYNHKETEMYIPKKIFDIETGVNRLLDIDSALANVKIADPAVGSGAFPLGMVNEIVRARENITAYLSLGKNSYEKKIMYIDRSQRNLKINAIKNSIYAVDIDPSAVDISKLRLWLSLVVDDEISPEGDNDFLCEHKDPSPLPNLDCNIICGNSLIDELECIKLVNESELFGNNQEQLIFGQKKYDGLLSQLFEAQDKLFFEKDHNEKYELKKKIQQIIDHIINHNIEITGKIQVKEIYENSKLLSSKPFILWQLEFGKVFKDNGGFDIVIGNPPYVSVKGINREDKEIFKRIYKSGQGRFNLFTLMIENGIKILNYGGVLIFIQPEGLFTNIEYRHTRELIVNECKINQIVLFDKRVFEAAVDTAILCFEKTKINVNEFPVIKNMMNITNKIEQSTIINASDFLIPVTLTDASSTILEKININSNKRLGEILEIQQGIIYSGRPKEEIFSNIQESPLYKKCLDGRDVLKWFINWEAKAENKYIEYSSRLHRPREERIFLANEKILLPRKSTTISCGYDEEQYYALNTAYIGLIRKIETTKNFQLKYILALMNSKLLNYYYKNIYLGWQITIPALYSLPICYNADYEAIIIENVNEILKLKKLFNETSIKKLELKLDQLIYKIYKLNDDEINTIEQFYK